MLPSEAHRRRSRMYGLAPSLHILALAAVALCTVGGTVLRADWEGFEPTREKWGDYTVAIDYTDPDDMPPKSTVRVLDSRGRVLYRTETYYVYARQTELTGRKPSELVIVSTDGGSMGTDTCTVLSREQGVRQSLRLTFDAGRVYQTRDLNFDGRTELICIERMSLTGYADSVADSPSIVSVVGWDGSKYSDMSKRCPQPCRARALEYRTELCKVLKKGSEYERRLYSVAYYANAVVAGDGNATRGWLMGQLPAATRGWFARHEKEIAKKASHHGPDIVSGPGTGS